MLCPQCYRPLSSRAAYCPYCGAQVQEARTPAPHTLAPGEARDVPQEVSTSRGCTLTLLVIVLTLLALLGLVGLGVAAFYRGLKDRARVEQQAGSEHLRRGTEYMQQKQFELAIAELELSVQLDAKNEQARARLQEAQQGLQIAPGPTAEPQSDIRLAYLQQLQELHRSQDWSRIQIVADQLRSLDADYERETVEDILFDALYQNGVQLVHEERLQEAVRLFDRAMALKPERADVQRAKTLAERYMKGLSFWQADWGKAIEQFQNLYSLAPDYQDVQQRLYQAYVSYGDTLAEQGDWCPAAEKYGAALEIIADNALVAKHREATDRCSTAGPSVASAPLSTIVPSGTFVGSVIKQTAIDSNKVVFRGQVLNRRGEGMLGIQVQIKAWNWKAIAVTDGNGQFSFDGLRDPVTYTLSLPSLQCQPVDAPGAKGQITWVQFRQKR
jgi:tetratricopeptide (TPR) repeat protein